MSEPTTSHVQPVVPLDHILDCIETARRPGTRGGEHFWEGNAEHGTIILLREMGYKAMRLCFCDACDETPFFRVERRIK